MRSAIRSPVEITDQKRFDFSKTTGRISTGMPKWKANRREKLLDQGAELLTEHGYHGTGLKKILDTIQVPKGSFYNYFESKEKFVAEIIDLYSENNIANLDAYIESAHGDPVATIRNLHFEIIAEMDKHHRKGCLLGNLAAEIGSISEPCQAAMKRAISHWKRRFHSLFEQGQRQGLIRDDISTDALSDLLWSTWQGGLLRMKIDGGTAHLNLIVEVMFDKLLRPDRTPKD